jgi:hypothetical protein
MPPSTPKRSRTFNLLISPSKSTAGSTVCSCRANGLVWERLEWERASVGTGASPVRRAKLGMSLRMADFWGRARLLRDGHPCPPPSKGFQADSCPPLRMRSPRERTYHENVAVPQESGCATSHENVAAPPAQEYSCATYHENVAAP